MRDKDKETIWNIHKSLNDIAQLAKEIYAALEDREGVVLGWFKGHYIRRDDNYEYQHYPLPVIAIKGVGDIGVNLDKVWFEYFLDKHQALKVDYRQLIALYKFYKVEIYEGEACGEDFYQYGDSEDQIRDKILKSKTSKIGFALYIDKKQHIEHIIKLFDSVSQVLEGKEEIVWLED